MAPKMDAIEHQSHQHSARVCRNCGGIRTEKSMRWDWLFRKPPPPQDISELTYDDMIEYLHVRGIPNLQSKTFGELIALYKYTCERFHNGIRF